MTKPPVDIKNIPILISAQDLAARVNGLAREIAATIPRDMLIVSLLRGSFVFTSDLIRALHNSGAQPQVDFLTLSSYGSGTTSKGVVNIVRDLADPVEGHDVLIVDDILESGRTLTFARNLMMERKAKSVKIAVLLEKPGKRKVDVTADFVGFKIEDEFVIGYGLDYANFFRELPYIGYIPSTTAS
ncbi:MAG: hypoxanthine phosphoribosyltransferase [Rickettsiales bacterium]|nr:hypoxanthine phosphoribosyltransferase [Rickettsiales bacterium]